MGRADLLPRTGGVAFPIVFRLAARLAQATPEELLADPGRLRTALLQAQQQMGYRWLVTHWEPGLVARVLSRSAADPTAALSDPEVLDEGPLHVVLDAAERLVTELPQCVVVSVIPGPLALLADLGAPDDEDDRADACYDVADWLAGHAKRWLAVGAKAVLVDEDWHGHLPVPDEVLTDAFSPLWNSIAYYDALGILRAPPDLSLPAEAVAGADLRVGTATDVAICTEVPLEWFTASSEDPLPVPVGSDQPRLWVSAGEVPAGADPGRVAAFVEAAERR